MPKAGLYNIKGEKLGEVELSEKVFGVEPSEHAVAEAVKHHLAARRQGTQSTLTRAEVSGGGRKPWRQKGTGRARQGSSRSPQWTHGGVALGPKPRSYRYSINKKLKRLALLSVLSDKAVSGNVYVVDNLDFGEIKTKRAKAFLESLEITGKALFVTPEPRDSVYKSARNLTGVSTTVSNLINTYEVLNRGAFIVDKRALEKIEEVYAK